MSILIILMTCFRKIFTENEDAESICFLFLIYKTKKRKKEVLLILGVNRGIQIIGLLMYFFQSI